jgi:hypothetical protein
LIAAGTVGSDTADEPDAFPGMKTQTNMGDGSVTMEVNKIPEVAE